jgi:DNA-binding CsgD family transcriptional regulator/tetratricopeptide (TPR) repeat protein
MAGRESLRPRPIAGRTGETAVMLAVVRDVGRGRSSTLLISGEAGIGKTSLLDDLAVDGVEVIRASCLPLTSLASPLLPLRTAVPDGSAFGPDDNAVLAFDAWLDRAASRRPVVLAVDDLQWADQSTLDVLMYVIAGRDERRLAVVVTLRPGQPRLRQWLADVRRLPRVTELPLARLDRVATREQIEGLLGRAPYESLVDEVFARTAGNPYLTRLLVQGVSPDAGTLPGSLPTQLRDALVRTWCGLSAPAQEATSLIALAGRPVHSARITDVGFSGPALPPLREAVTAHVLQVDAAGRYWFCHPMLAEALVEELLPEERRSLHTRFAETVVTSGPLSVDDTIEVADHYYQAGRVEDAYRWALRAADVVTHSAETLRLLRRALDLQPEVARPEQSRAGLLRRIREAAIRAGRLPEALAAVDDLLVLVDRDEQPLVAAELLVSRMQLRFWTGREFAGLADVTEAHRLSARFPDSPEYALATAELASSRLWHGDLSGGDIATTALRLANTCDSDRARIRALIATVMARGAVGDYGGVEQAREAQAIAARTRDFLAFVSATYCLGNSLDVADSHEVDAVFRDAHERLTAMGAPHPPISEMVTAEADGLLQVGEWRACLERLRFALGANPSPIADTRARLAAALLACRQGRQAEAEQHLARAEELFGETSDFLAFNFDAVRAELATAAGDTERAFACALTGLRKRTPPLFVEYLLPLATRALADEAQAHRDRRVDPSAAVRRLDELRWEFPRVVTDDGGQSGAAAFYRTQIEALQQLTEAETARGRRSPGEPQLWGQAAEAAHVAGLRWEEAYCRWRQAQAGLRDGATRRAAIQALRTGHRLATDLAATPLLAGLETLAAGTHADLTQDPEPATPDRHIPGLTTREQEILTHIVAGHTYTRIAEALVISEKTVSTHVSNMLRKTGSVNRLELAELAHRMNAPGGH